MCGSIFIEIEFWVIFGPEITRIQKKWAKMAFILLDRAKNIWNISIKWKNALCSIKSGFSRGVAKRTPPGAQASKITLVLKGLTLFVTGGGGIKCPHYQESVRHFPMGNARITKTLDFVPLSTRHIPAKPFFKISIFKKNIKRCQKYPKGGPFCEFQIFGVLARNSVFLMAWNSINTLF